jgi:hypothetical protein
MRSEGLSPRHEITENNRPRDTFTSETAGGPNYDSGSQDADTSPGNTNSPSAWLGGGPAAAGPPLSFHGFYLGH